MYIHLGGEKVISTKDLVAILKLSSKESDYSNVETVDDKQPKSLVITHNKMYYSSISATTLTKQIK